MKNTITGIKAIVGKKFHSEEIQSEMGKVAYQIVESGAGGTGVKVQYNDDDLVISPERAMSMLLKAMQKIAEEDQKAPVTDVVLSVPAYFTDAERHALLDAAKMIGLNVLRLMNDTTAAALSYGIYKTDLPEDKPTNVVFTDVGAGDTTVAGGTAVYLHSATRSIPTHEVTKISSVSIVLSKQIFLFALASSLDVQWHLCSSCPGGL